MRGLIILTILGAAILVAAVLMIFVAPIMEQTYEEREPYTEVVPLEYQVTGTLLENAWSDAHAMPRADVTIFVENLDAEGGDFGVTFTLVTVGGATTNKSVSAYIAVGGEKAMIYTYLGDYIESYAYEVTPPTKEVMAWRTVERTRMVTFFEHLSTEETTPTPTPIPTPGPQPEATYSQVKDLIQTAVTSYLNIHGGELPIQDVSLTVTVDGVERYIIDICALLSPSGSLLEVPAGAVAIISYNNDNCDGGDCACDPFSHYVWAVDPNGDVFSSCAGSDCLKNNADGYQDVWP